MISFLALPAKQNFCWGKFLFLTLILRICVLGVEVFVLEVEDLVLVVQHAVLGQG